VTALAFLVAFLGACLLAIARHPIFGLMAYVGVYYLNPPLRWWGQGFLLNFRWSYIAAVVTLAAILIHRTGRTSDAVKKDPIIYWYFAFLGWLALQLFWVIDTDQQKIMLEYYAKFAVAVFLIYRAVDSQANFRLFLWAHIVGCFYFGWLAYTQYSGGRFEGFGGAGVKDANEAALTIGTAALAMGSLLLWEKMGRKVALVGMAPFLVNAIVATVSRSGFLAISFGGLIFNLLSPPKYRKWVVSMSALALVLMLMLTTESYWQRIETIAYKGQQVEGVDTGGDRLEMMQAQLRMFRDHPLGCGHQCTTLLSPSYVSSEYLDERLGVRASHNTFLSMLVEQGVPGALMYIALLGWATRQILFIAKRSRTSGGFIATMLPAIAGSIAAIFLADMFVPYVRYEVRFWFVGLLLALSRLQVTEEATQSEVASAPASRDNVLVPGTAQLSDR
jgi:O-antigen ligase